MALVKKDDGFEHLLAAGGDICSRSDRRLRVAVEMVWNSRLYQFRFPLRDAGLPCPGRGNRTASFAKLCRGER